MPGKVKTYTSPAGRCVAFLKTIHPKGATLAQLVEHIDWNVERGDLGAKLHIRARSRFAPDIEKIGKLWVYRPPFDDQRAGHRFQTPQAWKKPGEVAGTRTLPEGEWRPPAHVIRPGALDYRAVPSLQGNQRVPYKPPLSAAGGNAVTVKGGAE